MIKNLYKLMNRNLNLFPFTLNLERFEEENDIDEETVSMLVMIVTLFLGIIYFTVMLLLWLRIVYFAFKGGMVEGFSSIFFYNLYVMYFVGSTLSVRTNRNSMFS